MGCCLAEGEGFEPPKPFRACRVSSAVPSTTRPSFLGVFLGVNDSRCLHCAYNSAGIAYRDRHATFLARAFLCLSEGCEAMNVTAPIVPVVILVRFHLCKFS